MKSRRAATIPKGGTHHRRLRRKVAWAAAGLLIIGVPLLLVALVGLPHLFRGSLVRNVIARSPGGEPPGLDSPHFAHAFALLTGTPLTAANAVEVLANGDATFPRLWSDLRSARRSITVQMYYAGPGSVADSATAILTERARAGVEVYFLYDAFGVQGLPRRYLDTLREAGVRVAEFRPVRWYALDRASHRSHIRGIVVDGAVAYNGGIRLRRQVAGWRAAPAGMAGDQRTVRRARSFAASSRVHRQVARGNRGATHWRALPPVGRRARDFGGGCGRRVRGRARLQPTPHG